MGKHIIIHYFFMYFASWVLFLVSCLCFTKPSRDQLASVLGRLLSSLPRKRSVYVLLCCGCAVDGLYLSNSAWDASHTPHRQRDPGFQLECYQNNQQTQAHPLMPLLSWDSCGKALINLNCLLARCVRFSSII